VKIGTLSARLLAACAALLVRVISASAAEQTPAIPFDAPSDEVALEAAMPQLARQVIDAPPATGPGLDPMTLYRLEVVAGDYAAAEKALDDLARRFSFVPHPDKAITLFRIVVEAMKSQAVTHGTFEAAFTTTFQNFYVPLGDKAAADVDYWTEVNYWLGTDVTKAKNQVQADLAATKSGTAIPRQNAISLVRDYQIYLEQSVIRPLLERLVAEDDNRRYMISDVLIRTKDGASLSAYVARPRNGAVRAPATLFFTIYSAPVGNRIYAKYAAAHGYVGVIADARGKRLSQDEIRPFETEAVDTNGVLDWISKQPWCDGQVGMFGGSYSGFAQWAALKHPHPALKTIVPYVADLPGDGLPMEHNIFLNANYAWNFYVTDNRYVDEVFYGDGRWNDLPWKWFASGRPYREIDAVDGTPNPLLQRELKHPSYDAYWQAMVPYKAGFAKINIPILEISGYAGGDSVSDYFLPEHERYNPGAEHYLVIGPYGHGSSQSNFKSPVLDGYPIDPVAQINTPALTFEWFDYVMKGGKKPALLKDQINFEVMGDNIWRHAPSIDRMSDRVLTLYLTDAPVDGRHRLSQARPEKSRYLTQAVDFADRKSTNNLYPTARLSDRINTEGALSFISDPIAKPLSVNGQISGSMRSLINKRDMDFTFAVYEITPDGRFFNLAYYLGRASYAWDMSRRHLLTPGKIETIPFSRTGIVSRQLSRGSRLLVLLTVNKNPFAQVNYGTGKDVSDESIADAKEPLVVRWYNDSLLRIPVSDQ
jgi:uncharacterized protein